MEIIKTDLETADDVESGSEMVKNDELRESEIVD
jgi:hypothetical protein